MDPTLTRNLTAGLTGVNTALLGGLVPVVGMASGVVMQLLEPEHTTLRRVEHVTEGVVDGSAALLGYSIFARLSGARAATAKARGTVIRPMAQGWQEPVDSDAMIG